MHAYNGVLTILSFACLFVFCVSVKVNLTALLLCVCVHSAWKVRPRNDLYRVRWDVKPYSLTHPHLANTTNDMCQLASHRCLQNDNPSVLVLWKPSHPEPTETETKQITRQRCTVICNLSQRPLGEYNELKLPYDMDQLVIHLCAW